MSPELLAGAATLAAAAAVRLVLRVADRRALAGRRPAGIPLPSPPGALLVALADADLAWSPAALWAGWLALVAGATGGGLLAGGPPLALVGGAVVVAAPVLVLGAARGRRVRNVEAALPDVLDAVARSLRSGATLGTALTEAAAGGGPAADDLHRIVGDIAGGAGLAPAIASWPDRSPSPGVRLATAALTLSAEAGGAAARAVDGVAATLRANLAVAAEVRAQAAQARLSALVIALAPIAFGVLAAGTDRRTAAFLLATPFGLGCLVLGLTLDAVAAWWMQRITAAPA